MCLNWKKKFLFFIQKRPIIYVAKRLTDVPPGSVIFFPIQTSFLSCGFSGFLAIKPSGKIEANPIEVITHFLLASNSVFQTDCEDLRTEVLAEIFTLAKTLKTNLVFTCLMKDATILKEVSKKLEGFQSLLQNLQSRLSAGRTSTDNIELIKDIDWCLRFEIIENIQKISELGDIALPATVSAQTISLYKEINAVCNSINRLEVRGRDSAGISVLLSFSQNSFQFFWNSLSANQQKEFQSRQDEIVLENYSIRFLAEQTKIHIAFVYKIASEIGSLGDNISFLRSQIKKDFLLKTISRVPFISSSIQSHTRWASVGDITEANCHPLDQMTENADLPQKEILFACLNGDIDNYLEIIEKLVAEGIQIPKTTTSDTKIIPLWVSHYRRQGLDLTESFRQAVNDFKGSHAICLQSSAESGKLFLAQRGSGQAVFVGLAPDGYIPSSEVYGFVEETDTYIRLDGESYVNTPDGSMQGKIFVLDNNYHAEDLQSITAMAYNGSRVLLAPKDIRITQITSRDIDRQNFPHFFLKEISESPLSVERTLQNRWEITDAGHYIPCLKENSFPVKIQSAFKKGKIRHIYFIGQGTAGVAGKVCANTLEHYLKDQQISVKAIKASEFSGFVLPETNDVHRMSDTLVIAITQSGTTTDTNHAIDMVRRLGAKTISIVNRRDSDITFKTDGVLYTSTGRDIEMSVASTKAFYSQIAAGVLLALQIGMNLECLPASRISEDIRQLLRLPDKMRQIISQRDVFQKSATQHALSRVHWAVVGSGPNKAAADEIRIKLSELCYKTISSDYIEDKKHIDLSSEPLILVCAMGTRENVISDILKDVAIFKAHKAVPLVIAQEGDYRFSPYATDVFYSPGLPEHLAPVLNTLCGHLWGYYAALTIHGASNFFYEMREEIRSFVRQYKKEGKDAYDILLDTPFHRMIVRHYLALRARQKEKQIPLAMGAQNISEIILLFKYLSGRLPMEDFDSDFEIQPSAPNMLDALFARLNKIVSDLSRPIDAIKHQAKTVTVGTSRLAEPLSGTFLNILNAHHLSPLQVSTKNILVLRQAEKIVSMIQGSLLYKIEGLDVLGNPTDTTTISVVEKTGVSQQYKSRTETDNTLKGIKRIIAREKNIFLGYGRSLKENLIILPILSHPSHSTATVISHLLLLHVSIKEEIPVNDVKKALGGKLERIQNLLQEYGIPWEDTLLSKIPMADWFGLSAEKTVDQVVQIFQKSSNNF